MDRDEGYEGSFEKQTFQVLALRHFLLCHAN